MNLKERIGFIGLGDIGATHDHRSSRRYLGLHQHRQLGQRLLPPEVAHLGRHGLRNTLLRDVEFGAAQHLSQNDADPHFAGQVRIVKAVGVAESFIWHELKVLADLIVGPPQRADPDADDPAAEGFRRRENGRLKRRVEELESALSQLVEHVRSGKPVAATTKSAGSSCPEARRRPFGVKLAIACVTTSALPS